jgi:hypothetical protein
MEKCEKCGENVSIVKHCEESFSVEIDENGKEHYFHLRCLLKKEPPNKLYIGGWDNPSLLSKREYERRSGNKARNTYGFI